MVEWKKTAVMEEFMKWLKENKKQVVIVLMITALILGVGTWLAS